MTNPTLLSLPSSARCWPASARPRRQALSTMPTCPTSPRRSARPLITALSQTGGHLGPNLGVVELTIALHRVFSTPKDKFVFDVAHQGYVHKMLTGRADRIHTIRHYKGLNGFLLRSESEHDCLRRRPRRHRPLRRPRHGRRPRPRRRRLPRRRRRRRRRLHLRPDPRGAQQHRRDHQRFIVVLNDNEWSIDKNVGAIARYFNALQTHSTYAARARQGRRVRREDRRQGRPQARPQDRGRRQEPALPQRPLREIRPALLRPDRRPRPAAAGQDLRAPQDAATSRSSSTSSPRRAAATNPRSTSPASSTASAPTRSRTARPTPPPRHLLGNLRPHRHATSPRRTRRSSPSPPPCPAAPSSTSSRRSCPSATSTSASPRNTPRSSPAAWPPEGFKPFLAIYSTFMQRAYDMIIHDMALQNLPVRLCMDRGGLSGDDGPTHHGLFDIGYLRHVPGIVHMQPKDEDEFVDMLHTMAAYDDGPIRHPLPARRDQRHARSRTPRSSLEIGKAEVVAEGTDVALFGLGTMFDMAEETKALLEAKGLSVALINPRFIKPLDAAVHRAIRPPVPGRLHLRGPRPHQRLRRGRHRAPPRRRHPHPGRAHRLARRIHRTRQGRHPARTPRPHRRQRRRQDRQAPLKGAAPWLRHPAAGRSGGILPPPRPTSLPTTATLPSRHRSPQRPPPRESPGTRPWRRHIPRMAHHLERHAVEWIEIRAGTLKVRKGNPGVAKRRAIHLLIEVDGFPAHTAFWITHARTLHFKPNFRRRSGKNCAASCSVESRTGPCALNPVEAAYQDHLQRHHPDVSQQDQVVHGSHPPGIDLVLPPHRRGQQTAEVQEGQPHHRQGRDPPPDHQPAARAAHLACLVEGPGGQSRAGRPARSTEPTPQPGDTVCTEGSIRRVFDSTR